MRVIFFFSKLTHDDFEDFAFSKLFFYNDFILDYIYISYAFFFDWDRNNFIKFKSFEFNGVDDIFVKRQDKLEDALGVDFYEFFPDDYLVFGYEGREMEEFSDYWASDKVLYRVYNKLLLYGDLQFYHKHVDKNWREALSAQHAQFDLIFRFFKKPYVEFFWANFFCISEIIKIHNNPFFCFSFANFHMFDSTDFIDSFFLLQDLENAFTEMDTLDYHLGGYYFYYVCSYLTIIYLVIALVCWEF